ncbi:MAG: IS1096 element passenger TnpR family protein [Candidatus Odinarchaeia archaeon]
MKILSIKVSLVGKKSVYRVIEIKNNQKLSTLSKEILRSFDFNDDHLHFFTFENYDEKKTTMDIWESPKYWDVEATKSSLDTNDGLLEEGDFTSEIKLAKLDLRRGSKGYYLFDLGDEWIFEIEVLNVSDGSEKGKYPRVIMTSGKSPSQYEDFPP